MNVDRVGMENGKKGWRKYSEKREMSRGKKVPGRERDEKKERKGRRSSTSYFKFDHYNLASKFIIAINFRLHYQFLL